MKKFFVIFVLLMSFDTFSAPSNAAKALESWVYYALLRIDEKESQKRYAEVEEDYRELIYQSGWSTRSFDHAIILKKYGFFLIQRDRAEEGLEFIDWALRK